ncbi:MAG TPA: enolase C-terminal domain-like protein [Rhizomicrobium sp.]|jgi:L-alanine-DL-glutamate epimerase-like enolase superfamily enzyme|nr:enolase C-terminal domain-like protein [Rhizomicrobium sp.]
MSVGTTASAHAASSVRNFRIHELANWVDWWPTLVTRPGPFWKDGYFTIEDKPGLGFDIDPMSPRRISRQVKRGAGET